MSATRTSARVVLLDDDGAVLLLCGSDPAITDGIAPRWWFTVGGIRDYLRLRRDLRNFQADASDDGTVR